MAKPRNAGYIPGDHWVVCDRSGAVIRQSKAKRTWDGLVVKEDWWEPRHPQDFVRARQDSPAAKGLVRPEPENVFIATAEVPPYNATAAVAGRAIAGLAVAGVDKLLFESERESIPSYTFDMSL